MNLLPNLLADSGKRHPLALHPVLAYKRRCHNPHAVVALPIGPGAGMATVQVGLVHGQNGGGREGTSKALFNQLYLHATERYSNLIRVVSASVPVSYRTIKTPSPEDTSITATAPMAI